VSSFLQLALRDVVMLGDLLPNQSRGSALAVRAVAQ